MRSLRPDFRLQGYWSNLLDKLNLKSASGESEAARRDRSLVLSGLNGALALAKLQDGGIPDPASPRPVTPPKPTQPTASPSMVASTNGSHNNVAAGTTTTPTRASATNKGVLGQPLMKPTLPTTSTTTSTTTSNAVESGDSAPFPYARCARANCACHTGGASYNGIEGFYCCLTCRNGQPCAKA